MTFFQVIIASLLTAIECLVVLITMATSGAADTMFIYPTRSRNQLVCYDSGFYTSIIVPYSFDVILIVACTMYAFRTRDLPENFNETKFIAFTMYTTWVVWIAFIPVYVTSSNKVLCGPIYCNQAHAYSEYIGCALMIVGGSQRSFAFRHPLYGNQRTCTTT